MLIFRPLSLTKQANGWRFLSSKQSALTKSVAIDANTKVFYKESGDLASRHVLVLLHGAPGSHHDFRYLTPQVLEQQKTTTKFPVRVLEFDLPGFGQSCTTAMSLTSAKLTEIMHSVLQQLQLIPMTHKNPLDLYLLGHSFGGHLTSELALKQPEDYKGLVYLASTGVRPHKGVYPFTGVRLLGETLHEYPQIHKYILPVLRMFYVKILGFRDRTTEEAVLSGQVRIGTTDFSTLSKNINGLSNVPSLCAWAEDDHLIEKSVFEEFASMVGDGPRLPFRKGGHNIQKTHAEELGRKIVEFMESVSKK